MKMKKMMFLMLMLITLGTASMNAQVKIGGNDSPAKGALLDLNGDYKGGLLLPNVAITNLGVIPAGFTERGGADTAEDLTGMIVWSTDDVNTGLYMWDGNNWQSLMGQGGVAPCTGPATAPMAVTIPAGPFANDEVFEVSCTATEDGTTFFIWTAPAGLSITGGQGTKTIRVAGPANTYDKDEFTVFAVNPCGASATADGGNGQIVVKDALSTTPPPNTTIEIPSGGDTELDAGTVSGGNCGSYSYQWQVFNSPNWQNITGATGAKYQTPALTAEAQYRRIATCGSETVLSATITVTIKQVTEPTSVTASSTAVCSGDPTTLSYTGGSGATFVWYSGSCGGTQAGTGNNLQVSPTATTVYYGRWESGSSYSDCKPVTVTVNTVPANPGDITLSPTSITVGQTTTATVDAVAGATSYVWTLPDGLSAASLETTDPTLVITGGTAGTYAAGSITVQGRNDCGLSAFVGVNDESLTVNAPSYTKFNTSKSCTRTTKSACVCDPGWTRSNYGDATNAMRDLAKSYFTTATYWFVNDIYNNGEIAHYSGSTWTVDTVTYGNLYGCFQ
ncbi:hypothetical protein FACS189440_09010 [Bacteroidia bacterium]|nr:hypothetical protein FACS189440_09010 [Bacteroidia bacterium]